MSDDKKGVAVSKEELIEREASEIIRITGCKPVEFVDYDLVTEVFQKAMRRFHYFGALCVPVSLSAVYLLGYIQGVRAERAKRKNAKILS